MSEENKNIENFFKGRLKANDFIYQESDWEKLNKRLDEAHLFPDQSPFSLTKGKLIVIGILLITLGFFAGWMVRDGQNSDKTSNNRVESFQANHEVKISSTDNAVDSCVEEIVNNHTTGDHTNVFVKSDHLLEDKKMESQKKGMPKSAILNRDARDQSGTAVPQEYGTLQSAHEDNRVAEVSKWYIYPSYLKSSTLTLVIPDYSQFEVENNVVKEHKSKQGRFSIGLSMSPALNSAGLGNRVSLSNRTGLLLYYRPFPRISLSTGVLYDRKRYKTSSEEYKPPKGYWKRRTNGVAPSTISGQCGVLDFPVNVGIDLTQTRMINFGISLGMSNYILLDEAYNFEFDEENPEAATSWLTDKDTYVFQGILNLSAYVTIKTGKNTEILVEPYFKKPIKDIGWGNVALYSMGTQFTLRYNFTKSH